MKDSNKTEKMYGVTLLILFMATILAGFIFSMVHIREVASTGNGLFLSALRDKTSVSEIPSAFEDYYNSLYSDLPFSLDAFSFTQRVLGKHETRNFEVLKSNDGALYLHGTGDVLDAERLTTIADECRQIWDETRQYGGLFLYVQAPFKNVGQVKELADYSVDYTEDNENCLDNLIRDMGIPVLDLREWPECRDYYRTDHHWTVHAAFHAAELIADELERVYGIDLTGHEYYGDLENYEPVTFKDCFLGSIGIKVGPYYAGRDDFTVYRPKFDTDFTFEHYTGNELQFRYSGTFWETFINQKILDDSTYNNKFNANMRGAYAESIIKNHMAQNNYKGLLISHSYGRAMAQYMCLDYLELRFLDPQKGRYNENLLDYVREYQPDVVVYMYNNIVNVGDGNWE